MGGKQAVNQAVAQKRDQIIKLENEVKQELKNWNQEVIKRNNGDNFTSRGGEATLVAQQKQSLERIAQILKPVLAVAKGDPEAINVYEIVESALISTFKLISQSATAESKIKQGYYLTSTGKGIIRIEYYMFYRKIQAKYFINSKSQTQIGYGYAIAPYSNKFTLQQLGNLVEGMKLNEKQKKSVLVSLSKFATDATPQKMKAMKQVTKQAEDFW